MVYVKRLFVILLIFILLTYNVGFCADTFVNYTASASNNFYNSFLSINTILTSISSICTAYIPSIYSELQNVGINTGRLFNYRYNSTQAEKYILTEQDNYLDIFIAICQRDETIRNLIKTHPDYHVYAYTNSGNPADILFIFYTDSVDKQTYQSNPYHGATRQFDSSIALPNNLSFNDRLFVYSSQITSLQSVYYVKSSTNYVLSNYTGTITIPTCCLGYESENLRNYLGNLRGTNATTNAINDNTQAIKDSTDRILSEQSDTITDTGVTDSSSDNSPNLQSTFNTMSSAFTTRNTSTKTFVFTLPNGQSYNFTLANNLLTNMLRGYGNTFFAFYQAIFWCIFGGYVLFDFKRIINKFKGGDIDSVVSTSSPIDNVVKASLG